MRYTHLNSDLILDRKILGPDIFQVELVNPTGGAAVGVAGTIIVSINASDNAYGVYQFADDALQVMAQETGDVGYKSVFLRVGLSVFLRVGLSMFLRVGLSVFLRVGLGLCASVLSWFITEGDL